MPPGLFQDAGSKASSSMSALSASALPAPDRVLGDAHCLRDLGHAHLFVIEQGDRRPLIVRERVEDLLHQARRLLPVDDDVREMLGAVSSKSTGGPGSAPSDSRAENGIAAFCRSTSTA